MVNIDKQEILKRMSILAYQKHDQTLWDEIKEVFELSDKEYLEIQKKAPRWARSQVMSNKKANEDKSEYELVSASKDCDDFSLLSYYSAENNRARSLAGFQERLEVAILAYNMAYCLERFN